MKTIGFRGTNHFQTHQNGFNADDPNAFFAQLRTHIRMVKLPHSWAGKLTVVGGFSGSSGGFTHQTLRVLLLARTMNHAALERAGFVEIVEIVESPMNVTVEMSRSSWLKSPIFGWLKFLAFVLWNPFLLQVPIYASEMSLSETRRLWLLHQNSWY